MNKIHKRRIYLISFIAVGLISAASLILYALKQNINVFLTPHQLASKPLPSDYHFRLGGMVKSGSIIHDPQSLGVQFMVTDFKERITGALCWRLARFISGGQRNGGRRSIERQGVFIATRYSPNTMKIICPKMFIKRSGKAKHDTFIR